MGTVWQGLALALHRKEKLNGDGVVGTVMTNRGLELCLRDAGLTLHRANVGDRYILEMMRSGGFNLGGEPSGHILMTHLARSGDGLLAALQMLALMQEAEQPAQEQIRAQTCQEEASLSQSSNQKAARPQPQRYSN